MKNQHTIVIVGGSFNPPTIAHIQLARIAKDRVNADYVLLVPTKISYMQKWKKYQKGDIMNDEIRVKALKSLENDWLKVDLCELNGLVSGSSIETLEYVKERYHTQNVFFAIGTDKLEEIPRWHKSKELLNNNKFLVVQRNHDSVDMLLLSNPFLALHKDAFICCDTKYDSLQEISSTRVREKIKERDYKNIKQMVPEGVYKVLEEYIINIDINKTEQTE